MRKADEQENDQEIKSAATAKANTSAAEKGQRTRGPKKLKFTYQEQKDYEMIEAVIAELEEKIAALDKEIEASAYDFVKLNQFMVEKEEAEAVLEEKMERWMYLEELAAKIVEQ